MGMHLRQRLQRRITHRIQSIKALIHFVMAFFSSYRLAEFLPLTPLLAVLVLLSCFPDWVLEKADQGAEWMLYVLLGFKRAELRDNTTGQPTGRSCLYSVAGALDPDFSLPDTRLLAVPRSEADREHAFPSKQAASWGNATFLALCMKVAYEDWAVVRDVVNHEWRVQGDDAASRDRTYLRPRFVKGCSFYFMQPAGTESSEELSHIHLDSDACLIAVERPCAAGDQPGAVGEGAALVLAFRGTEPLELSDFQSDFDAVPEAGDWGSLHPGFLLALGLDPNLDPYHQTLTTYTALTAEAAAAEVIAGRAATPYEVLRNQINSYMTDNPTAKLYVTGHSLGGALAVVFMGALLHDTSKQAAAAKARIGALYTFGQPRVGDYEFLCHLSVSLLEPAAGSSSSSSADGTAAASAGGSSSSKLRGLWGGAGRQQEETAGPSLTSRYIRVVNTYDIVPHIPPTLCNLYQHGGDLLYLQMLPGQVKWLTEQPMFFISGIWSSSLVKLYHFGAVKLGLRHGWWGSDNYIRFGMRLGAVALPFLIAGLNDHMPGDYCQQVANSDPAAWQPFKSRKKLSRWANAVMFTRALTRSTSSSNSRDGSDAAPAAGTAAAAAAGSTPAARSGSSGAAGGHLTLSSKLQAMLLQHADDAAENSSNGSRDTAADAVKVSPRGAAANGAVRRVAFSMGGTDAQKAVPLAGASGESGDSDGAGEPDASAKGGVAAAARLWGRLSPQ